MQIKTKKEQFKKEHDKLYNDYVKRVTPTHNCWLNMIKAFISGGIICMIGQGFYDLYIRLGFAKEIVSGYTTLTLVLISVVLTCFNLVNPITKFAGAGYLVPITGFANSVASCALEFKSEGEVFGIGCKIFTIAGPVILYGIVTSWILGFLYWLVQFVW
ncbi:MAG: SpoVA/SpoVAEb family sporulation membrane protein [Coprococcus sp.]